MMKINSNVLKIFAVITMIIDHIGCYFPSKIAPDTYYLMRSIGRLAMPIFLYLLVQGFSAFPTAPQPCPDRRR